MHITVNNTRLFFDVHGQKVVPDGDAMCERPTLVLIHGGPGFDHSHYKPLFDQLADVAQLVYVDMRGNGRSDYGSPEQWRFDVWAEDLRQFIDALEIEAPIILGQSFGGFVAQAFAIRHPDRYSKLVLSNTFARTDIPQIIDRFTELGGSKVGAVAARSLTSGFKGDLMEDYSAYCFPLYSTSGPFDPAISSRAVVNMECLQRFYSEGGEYAHFDVRQGLTKLTAPTLVLHGALDPITPIELGEEMVKCLDATIVEYHRFDHASHNLDRDVTEDYFSILRHFIQA